MWFILHKVVAINEWRAQIKLPWFPSISNVSYVFQILVGWLNTSSKIVFKPEEHSSGPPALCMIFAAPTQVIMIASNSS